MQAVGATTPAFTVLLGWLAYGHTETHRVCCALIPVVLGIVITSGFEPSFHIIGLLFLLSSTAARAYKSLLQVWLLVSCSPMPIPSLCRPVRVRRLLHNGEICNVD